MYTKQELQELVKKSLKEGYGCTGGGGNNSLEIGGDGYDRSGTFYNLTNDEYYYLSENYAAIDFLKRARRSVSEAIKNYLLFGKFNNVDEELVEDYLKDLNQEIYKLNLCKMSTRLSEETCPGCGKSMKNHCTTTACYCG